MITPHYMKVFNQVLHELNKMEARQRNTLADVADVSRATLYKWQVDPPVSPHLRTFVSVAEAMGYEVRLVKTRKGARLKAVA